MKYLATVGYYGTGSSAITDLVSEYSDVYNPTNSDYELKFFFGYNGIPKLHNYIINQQNYQMYAVRDFLSEAEFVSTFGTKMNYEKYFNRMFMKLTREYIRELGGTYYSKGYTSLDYYQLSKVKILIWRIINKVYSIVNALNPHKEDKRMSTVHPFEHKIDVYMFDISENEFFKITGKYLDGLFSSITKDFQTFMIDGIIDRKIIDFINKCFSDIRICIVDRDPRDVYLSMKYVWKVTKPSDINVEKFVESWKLERRQTVYEKLENVLKIQFEDMIYNYENTIRKIEEFMNLNPDNHIHIRTRFNPEVSKNNTRLWEKIENEKENIAYIENELSDWLYSYDKVK